MGGSFILYALFRNNFDNHLQLHISVMVEAIK